MKKQVSMTPNSRNKVSTKYRQSINSDVLYHTNKANAIVVSQRTSGILMIHNHEIVVFDCGFQQKLLTRVGK